MFTPPELGQARLALSRVALVWMAVGLACWTVALALTTNPPLTTATTLWWTAVAVVVLVAMMISLSQPLRSLSEFREVGAVVVTLAGWALLMMHDAQWSVLTFALYAMSFAKGRVTGVVLAAVITTVWLLVWISTEGPTWRLLIPFGAFVTGVVMSMIIYEFDGENETQAALIEELHATRQDLAASQRERGTLEERARFAGEIHDTLAQGFTSIVLLSRATQRNKDWESGVQAMEAVAAENLHAARRLVAAMRPVELDQSSLAEALQRQITTLGVNVDATFDVVGEPIAIQGAMEVAILRAVQEALLNVRTHAQADTVHLTLSYFDDAVALDIEDDGIGIGNGTVTNRGSLTGGQGLDALRHRASTLGGHLSIEPGATGGTVVSLKLPVDKQ